MSLVVAFEDGYIVVGNFQGFELDRPGSAWFSPDGTIWEAIELGGMTDFCPGYEGGPVPRAQVTAGGSSGTQIILTGTELTADRCYNLAAPGPERTVSWLSTDGRQWVRSRGPGAGDGYPEYVWAILGGWEAAVHEGLWRIDGGMNQSTAVWRSADGQAWSKTSFVVVGTNMEVATASAAGQRLLTYCLGDQHLIMTSADGEAWRRLDGALAEDLITHVVPPVGGESSSWLLLAGSGGTTAWTSSDLEQWRATVIAPDRLISTVVATPHEYLVSADPACQGDLCGREPQSQFVSPDGLHWTPFTPSIEDAILLVRGPAGVLAIGREDGTVWRLGP